MSVVPKRAEEIPVTIEGEVNPARTVAWLRKLIADARAWKAAQEQGREAA